MGSSCCAQQVAEEQDHELENKYKYDPHKQPAKGAFKKQHEDKKMQRQEDEEKNKDEDDSQIGNPLIEESVVAPDAKSHKSQHTQKSHQNNKRGLFSKQVSQFVKCEDD
ncbi:unnamed protein product (macronuclear) [Paramecium tetraurelia]|uniref:Uncharacterized protein n=1 Tax=Paramecium tetraurelia TaxID=5888 RepID=A0BS25_PARTE|nr:uncharacterized protein GSPATT00031573001 [Paramecium tetraurelia]CAK61342.1 unnamed protein product [Paramecium tetraurelia]|eukprot:XP_001428740.1 hypothetical protein (macronuclear) [Paramecium tetraurelia strain d4-2]